MWAASSAHNHISSMVEYITKSSLLSRALSLKVGREGEVLYCLYAQNDEARDKVYSDLLQMLPTKSELDSGNQKPPLFSPLSVGNGKTAVTTRP